jgi:hypothetical protein
MLSRCSRTSERLSRRPRPDETLDTTADARASRTRATISKAVYQALPLCIVAALHEIIAEGYMKDCRRLHDCPRFQEILSPYGHAKLRERGIDLTPQTLILSAQTVKVPRAMSYS